MSDLHLTNEELDEVLIGAGLPPDRAAHLSGCLDCRGRRDEVLAAIEAARLADPGARAMTTAREAALGAWVKGASRSGRSRWWLAVAAGLLLLVLLPLIRGHQAPPPPAFDANAVLRDVDAVLDRDPLTAAASEAVVDAVAPAPESGRQGGA